MNCLVGNDQLMTKNEIYKPVDEVSCFGLVHKTVGIILLLAELFYRCE